ncbi:c-type cytochrome [Polymorphobacter fuscus]|uniref:C-type cytochrome n=1 Tax=Sandarakinorhabdus fusca TaxID=1439888 RepID=A0A7C9LEM0_9SPHN|nr:cytochrome c family protein [Polymorphobacter fuscus]KAB7648499.1 cytochrome c family protein [Polymorphobacter fuscus]MQT16027.1 c-type cytochrome [Polymorphobacter fuscus]NJC07696.1 cytochrome c [Polymorphobacter fuscus]
MDSFEFNKYAGWGLAAVLTLLVVNVGSSAVFRPVKPEKPSYVIEGVVEEVAAGAAPAAAEQPIAVYLASATVEKGEGVFKKCAACHTVDKGGANGIGPNLYGIVGNVHAHSAGYAYSEVLAAMKGKPWSWEELSKWLTSPKTYAPGTKMAFAGIAKPEDRAALLVYLNSKSDAPQPLPAAPAADAAPAETAPAAGETAPAADAPAAAPAA